MSPENSVVIEIFGEGKTDVGHDPSPQPPTRGVVPILVHTLCGKPSQMRVKRYGMPFMQQQRGSLPQKVKFAKRQAQYNRSAGAVFVMDSEGELRQRRNDLTRGRRMEAGDLPMAIGVAHPCIEAWLLADASAIRQALDLRSTPQVPDEPEKLPAPRQDRERNPKTELARFGGRRTKELSVVEKDRIAAAMNDMGAVRTACPDGFAPFADEVEEHIHPLF
ncbi:MAG: hypothetical protein HQ582_05500 [Planctomycetes bacterium]|nr:hypothetical protein [Planctomycetota bacterium]